MEGIFDNGTGWHSITASLFQGASILVLIAAVLRLFVKPGSMVQGIDFSLANGTLVVLGSAVALVFAVLATVTGVWMTWGYIVISIVFLMLNKFMFVIFGIFVLVFFLMIWWRYGPGLWKDRSLTTAYVSMAVIQGIVAGVNGSLGGEAGLLGTVLDPVWSVLNIETRGSMILPTVSAVGLLAIIVAGVVGIAVWRFGPYRGLRSRSG